MKTKIKKKGPGRKLFVKGDPRINRMGGPRGDKKIPMLKILMAELLGTDDLKSLDQSNLAQVIKALVEVAKDKNHPLMVQAAREVLDRSYGKVTTNIMFETGPPVISITHNVVQLPSNGS